MRKVYGHMVKEILNKDGYKQTNTDNNREKVRIHCMFRNVHLSATIHVLNSRYLIN